MNSVIWIIMWNNFSNAGNNLTDNGNYNVVPSLMQLPRSLPPYTRDFESNSNSSLFGHRRMPQEFGQNNSNRVNNLMSPKRYLSRREREEDDVYFPNYEEYRRGAYYPRGSRYTRGRRRSSFTVPVQRSSNRPENSFYDIPPSTSTTSTVENPEPVKVSVPATSSDNLTQLVEPNYAQNLPEHPKESLMETRKNKKPPSSSSTVEYTKDLLSPKQTQREENYNPVIHEKKKVVILSDLVNDNKTIKASQNSNKRKEKDDLNETKKKLKTDKKPLKKTEAKSKSKTSNNELISPKYSRPKSATKNCEPTSVVTNREEQQKVLYRCKAPNLHMPKIEEIFGDISDIVDTPIINNKTSTLDGKTNKFVLRNFEKKVFRRISTEKPNVEDKKGKKLKVVEKGSSKKAKHEEKKIDSTKQLDKKSKEHRKKEKPKFRRISCPSIDDDTESLSKSTEDSSYEENSTQNNKESAVNASIIENKPEEDLCLRNERVDVTSDNQTSKPVETLVHTLPTFEFGETENGKAIDNSTPSQEKNNSDVSIATAVSTEIKIRDENSNVEQISHNTKDCNKIDTNEKDNLNEINFEEQETCKSLEENNLNQQEVDPDKLLEDIFNSDTSTIEETICNNPVGNIKIEKEIKEECIKHEFKTMDDEVIIIDENEVDSLEFAEKISPDIQVVFWGIKNLEKLKLKSISSEKSHLSSSVSCLETYLKYSINLFISRLELYKLKEFSLDSAVVKWSQILELSVTDIIRVLDFIGENNKSTNRKTLAFIEACNSFKKVAMILKTQESSKDGKKQGPSTDLNFPENALNANEEDFLLAGEISNFTTSLPNSDYRITANLRSPKLLVPSPLTQNTIHTSAGTIHQPLQTQTRENIAIVSQIHEQQIPFGHNSHLISPPQFQQYQNYQNNLVPNLPQTVLAQKSQNNVYSHANLAFPPRTHERSNNFMSQNPRPDQLNRANPTPNLSQQNNEMRSIFSSNPIRPSSNQGGFNQSDGYKQRTPAFTPNQGFNPANYGGNTQPIPSEFVPPNAQGLNCANAAASYQQGGNHSGRNTQPQASGFIPPNSQALNSLNPAAFSQQTIGGHHPGGYSTPNPGMYNQSTPPTSNQANLGPFNPGGHNTLNPGIYNPPRSVFTQQNSAFNKPNPNQVAGPGSFNYPQQRPYSQLNQEIPKTSLAERNAANYYTARNLMQSSNERKKSPALDHKNLRKREEVNKTHPVPPNSIANSQFVSNSKSNQQSQLVDTPTKPTAESTNQLGPVEVISNNIQFEMMQEQSLEIPVRTSSVDSGFISPKDSQDSDCRLPPQAISIFCANCDKSGDLRCSCDRVIYCSIDCQARHWDRHETEHFRKIP